MSIAIVLRTNGSRNVFRDAVISSLGSRYVDEALLCSGFFQENFKGSSYRVTNESLLSQVCAKSGVSLTTVGIHNSTWRQAYFDFQASMTAAGAKIQCYYKNGMRWHAKVFIGSMAGVPNIGIIGSSNMTRNAFSTGTRYNNECDVFLWDRHSPIAGLAAELADSIGDLIVVRAPYSSRLNDGQTVPELLKRVRSEVLSGDLRLLDGSGRA